MIIDEDELMIWASLARSDPGWTAWTRWTPAYVEHLVSIGIVEAGPTGYTDTFRLTDDGRSYAFDVLALAPA